MGANEHAAMGQETGAHSVTDAVTTLVRYGMDRGLIGAEDAVYTANSVFDLL